MSRTLFVCIVVGLMLSVQILPADEIGDVRNELRAAQRELSSLTRGGWQSKEYADAKKVYDELRKQEGKKRQAAVQSKPECAELARQIAALKDQENEAKQKMAEFRKGLEKDPDIVALKEAHGEARKLEQAARKAVAEKMDEKMKADPEMAAAQITLSKAGKDARELSRKMNSLLVSDNPKVAELKARVKELETKYNEMRKKKPAKKKRAPRKKAKKEE